MVQHLLKEPTLAAAMATGRKPSHLGLHHAQLPGLLRRVCQQVRPHLQHGGRLVVDDLRGDARHFLLHALLNGVLQLRRDRAERETVIEK